MSLYHAYNQTVADGTATSVVRPSDWNSAHNQQITLAGNTAGQSTVSGTNIAFQGGNNVTLSAITAAGAATILVSGANTVAQSVQPMYYSASGSTSSANTMAFGASNGVSFSLTNGSVVATVATNYMASNQSSNFVNTSQSSLFQQTSATSAITSAAFPSANTTKFAGTGFTSTTTAGTAVTAALGTNGLTMAVPAFITTYANDLTSGRAGTGFTSASTAGVVITAALGTNGLNMAVPAFITTYANDLTSGRAGTGFTSTTTAGTAITAALGTNGLSMAVPNYLTTYAAQTTQTQAAGSIAGIGYTSTTQAGSTVGLTQGTAGLSVAWPPFITVGSGGGGGYPVAFSASGGSSSFSTLTFSNNGNNVTFVNSGGQVALSHSLQPLSNTTQFAGTGTTLALTNLTGTIDVGSNGVALSLSGNAAGGGGGTVSYYDLYEFGNNTVLSSYGQNSLHFQLFEPGINITMTGVNILVSGSTSTAAGPSPNILGQTFSYGIYSQGTGASTSRLESMATSSFFLNALQVSTTSASYAIGQGANSFTASAANSTLLSFLSGIKALQMPFVTSLASSGKYAFVFANSTSLAVSGSNVLRISNVVMTAASGVSASYGLFYTGGALVSNSSLTQEFQQLVWSATSGAWPATIAYNALSNNGASINHAFAYFNA
jgi:hypothetical protein